MSIICGKSYEQAYADHMSLIWNKRYDYHMVLLCESYVAKLPVYKVGHRCGAVALHAGDRGLVFGRVRPKSLKQVVTAPLPNARKQVWVLRLLADDHYKGLALVTVSVAR